MPERSLHNIRNTPISKITENAAGRKPDAILESAVEKLATCGFEVTDDERAVLVEKAKKIRSSYSGKVERRDSAYLYSVLELIAVHKEKTSEWPTWDEAADFTLQKNREVFSAFLRSYLPRRLYETLIKRKGAKKERSDPELP